ncbi:MAG: hypothetical protein LWX56_14645 [Ignavibacteria bacterium]|nr:hypothetical protein [Ignavibacteria bacterium]
MIFHLENRVGINISKDKIQFIELVYFNNEFILDAIDEAYFADELTFSPLHDVKTGSLIQNAFNEIIAKHKIKSKMLFVSLPSSVFNILRLPFDHTLLEQDLLTQFRWDFRQLYPHLKSEEYSIQFHEIENHVQPLPKYAIAGAIHRKHLRMIRNFAHKNGFTLAAIDYSHFGSDCALQLNYQVSREGYNLSLFFDDRQLSFELLHQGKPVYLQLLKFTNYGTVPDVIEEQMLSLRQLGIPIEEITNAFVYGDSITPVLIETWENQTNLKYYPVNPFKKLTISSKLSGSKLLKEHFFTFSAAAGICYRLG